MIRGIRVHACKGSINHKEGNFLRKINYGIATIMEADTALVERDMQDSAIDIKNTIGKGLWIVLGDFNAIRDLPERKRHGLWTSKQHLKDVFSRQFLSSVVKDGMIIEASFWDNDELLWDVR
ncbi:hypothetical protein RIF29_16031 [Crotalaria pallida]|uniref:Uncharacterized protein n=1 Tax=Crotalaria pallida TaxID=3830 RepID=A0AAN9IE37_CROPI